MNANQPAFPSADKSVTLDGVIYHQVIGGLTKREYFAAMAMQAYVSSNRCNGRGRDAAIIAVEYANTLLAELARTEPKEGK